MVSPTCHTLPYTRAFKYPVRLRRYPNCINIGYSKLLLTQKTIPSTPHCRMNKRAAIDNFLQSLLRDYDPHVHAAGGYDGAASYLAPTLANSMLPMFSDRWASGPDQHTPEILPIMRPALLLASRLLKEYYPLLWFCRLTFGQRKQMAASSDTYLEATEYMNTPASVAAVENNIKELGEVVTLMFAPRSCKIGAYGMTYSAPAATAFFDQFSGTDWPPIMDKYRWAFGYRRCRPCIAMSASFQDFFRNSWSDLSASARYRVHFVFAIVLVHEIAHAYNFWLHGGLKEPLWGNWERHAELGYSWERHVIGRVINPVSYRETGGFSTLFDTELRLHETRQQRHDAAKVLFGFSDSRLTCLDARGKRPCKVPMFDPSDFRGNELFLSRPCKQYTAAIRAIPMAFIVSWFQESEWNRWKQWWLSYNYYVPPPLVGAFMIMYERDADQAQILRLLNPSFSNDAKILKKQEEAKSKKQPAKEREEAKPVDKEA
jgi:hypothetical protein